MALSYEISISRNKIKAQLPAEKALDGSFNQVHPEAKIFPVIKTVGSHLRFGLWEYGPMTFLDGINIKWA